MARLASGRLALVWNRFYPEGVTSYPTRGGNGNLSAVPTSWHREEVSLAFSADDGATWSEAQLEDPLSPYAWRGWSLSWEARPGTYNLLVRATDTEGNTQPVSQPWNSRGLANNMVQRVEVIVE